MTPSDVQKIFPLGNGALTVEFGREISVELNERAITLAKYLNANPFDGYIESVPAYVSTTVFFDVPRVRGSFGDSPTAFEKIRRLVESILPKLGSTQDIEHRRIEIPVSFASDDAPDLPIVAKIHGITTQEVIEIFTAAEYRVYMLGFLPGFAYMGEVDAKIEAPRKDSPRLKVPKGSVGIAGRQTGIYPFESPGGWQIIGRAEARLFDPDNENPCLLQPGDSVRFVNFGK